MWEWEVEHGYNELNRFRRITFPTKTNSLTLGKFIVKWFPLKCLENFKIES
jgi:hypothetical protein